MGEVLQHVRAPHEAQRPAVVTFHKVAKTYNAGAANSFTAIHDAVVAANVEEHGKETHMSEYKPLTREELNALAGEELPERAAMSLINANLAAPINAALALNVASDNSVAIAQATQNAPITQGI